MAVCEVRAVVLELLWAEGEENLLYSFLSSALLENLLFSWASA